MALDEAILSDRTNAIIGWVLTALLLLGGVESLLTEGALWGVFWLITVVLVSLPAALTSERLAIVPWPLLGLAVIALAAREASVYPESGGYLAVVALAFVVVVELDVFTPVELSRRFAVAFAVLTTMAVEALWIIAQYYSDVWLDTEFLGTQTEVQEDIVIVSAVGFVVGGLFYWYLATVEAEQTEVDSPNHTETR